MPNDKGWYDFQQPASKTSPARASDGSKGDLSGYKKTEHRDHGHADHDFNYKAKVTKSGGNYHDFGDQNAGLKFNGSEKDASLQHMKDRIEKGQRIRNFSGGTEISRIHTNNGGVTAYSTMPIKEVYTPATSNKTPSPNAVTRPEIEKTEGQPSANLSKLGKQIRDHKK